MATYEGKTDPLDHVDAFNDQMDLLQVTTLARCMCLAVTLSGTAKKWICQVEPETIVSWWQLSTMFMHQFQGARKYMTPLSRLASIKQGPNETLKAYIKHFNDELMIIHNPQKNGLMMAAISRVRPDTPFWDKLQKDECKSLAEFYRHENKIIHLETAREAIQAGKVAPAEKKNDNGKKQKNGDCHLSLDKMNKKPKALDQRVPRPPPSKFTNYTNLVSSREDVFMAMEQTGVFKWPDRLHGDSSKRNQSKYC